MRLNFGSHHGPGLLRLALLRHLPFHLPSRLLFRQRGTVDEDSEASVHYENLLQMLPARHPCTVLCAICLPDYCPAGPALSYNGACSTRTTTLALECKIAQPAMTLLKSPCTQTFPRTLTASRFYQGGLTKDMAEALQAEATFTVSSDVGEFYLSLRSRSLRGRHFGGFSSGKSEAAVPVRRVNSQPDYTIIQAWLTHCSKEHHNSTPS